MSPPITGTPASARPSYSSTTSATAVSDRAARLTTRPSGSAPAGGKIAEVHGRRAEAEVAPRDPVEPEVHALDERILGDHAAAGKLRRVVLDPHGEAAALELREQAELADVSEAHGSPGRRPGPRLRRSPSGRSRPRVRRPAPRPGQPPPGTGPARAAQPEWPSACNRRRGWPRRRGARPGSRRGRRRRRGGRPAGRPWPPVTITAGAPSSWSRSASRDRLKPVPAVSASASGRFGVMTVARGNIRATNASTASSRRSRAPELATITGSTTSGTGCSSTKPATVSMIGAEKSIPVLAASTPMSEKTAWSWARTNSGGTSSTSVTPTVFCAVRATIAVEPWQPAAANAFRSAWIPAPPPESEPAIVKQRGTGISPANATLVQWRSERRSGTVCSKARNLPTSAASRHARPAPSPSRPNCTRRYAPRSRRRGSSRSTSTRPTPGRPPPAASTSSSPPGRRAASRSRSTCRSSTRWPASRSGARSTSTRRRRSRRTSSARSPH